MAPRGRPRLTPAEYAERLQAYCRRHGVTATPAGIPPFPAGRRETEQHREWLSLYKAHARLTVPAAVLPVDGACAVCGLAVDPDHAVSYRSSRLHPECQRIVSLVEPLGPAGLDRLRACLWPAPSKRPRKTGRTPST